MCNACGFFCCAYDGFSKCGCDGCPEPACWDDEEFDDYGDDDGDCDFAAIRRGPAGRPARLRCSPAHAGEVPS
jgi:hypothetical protein